MRLFNRRPKQNTVSANLIGLVATGAASVYAFMQAELYMGIAIAIFALLFAYEAFAIGVQHRVVRYWERFIFLAFYLIFFILAVYKGKL